MLAVTFLETGDACFAFVSCAMVPWRYRLKWLNIFLFILWRLFHPLYGYRYSFQIGGRGHIQSRNISCAYLRLRLEPLNCMNVFSAVIYSTTHSKHNLPFWLSTRICCLASACMGFKVAIWFQDMCVFDAIPYDSDLLVFFICIRMGAIFIRNARPFGCQKHWNYTYHLTPTSAATCELLPNSWLYWSGLVQVILFSVINAIEAII